jgi:xanthine dehydrogenase small subunit
MNSQISFVLDGRLEAIDFRDASGLTPTTTVLNYLRSLPTHKGVKEGCAEGDCGACTVVLGERDADGKMHYKSVDSCLVFLPMIHGKQLVTVEDLKSQKGELHPVQQAMVETGGSQCGYCTPGFVMSLFSLYKNKDQPSRADIDDALTGNLCRCTGYRPIVEAAAKSCIHQGNDVLTVLEPKVSGLLKSIPHEAVRLQTNNQEYFRPVSLTEALRLKRDHREAIVLCGATDQALRVTKKHELLKQIIDLSGLDEIKTISENVSSVVIGAGVCLSEIMSKVHSHFPALHVMLSVFGSQQIRNLATLGGNLGTASPIGDTLPVLMAYNARVLLESIGKKREVPMDDFITGYRQTARKPDELITGIIIPKMTNGAVVKAYKVSKRKDLDISTVSAAFRLELTGGKRIENIKLVYGGMAERTKRATRTEEFLTGKNWEREAVAEAMLQLGKEFKPISDARSGAEFRTVAARNLLLKFWSETARKHA